MVCISRVATWPQADEKHVHTRPASMIICSAVAAASLISECGRAGTGPAAVAVGQEADGCSTAAAGMGRLGRGTGAGLAAWPRGGAALVQPS